ncbi:ATP-binding cassette domain-containing protein [Williamsoniiplasma luminosum]|uniref:ATP-binding cassette domain-containing protein n=1 Tax=Williamsoniiplasma luminosum TaxID=214888 RepID=UPI000472D9F1|nr:ATP-binding cassette domain-containing protein [Williamsoniiplasma luminosum]
MLQINNLELFYGDQNIFELKSLNIENNKSVIGIVGNNGSGKSSLMKIIAGIENEYTGSIKNNFTTLYFEQNYFKSNLIKVSGGEFCKQQIIDAFKKDCNLLILDEPTVHLDYDNRQFLIKAIKHFKGVVLLVTHDRELIKETADKIIEIKDKKITLFDMKYEAFLFEKENLFKQKELEVFHYKKHKNKLEKELEMRKIHSQKNKWKTKMNE